MSLQEVEKEDNRWTTWHEAKEAESNSHGVFVWTRAWRWHAKPELSKQWAFLSLLHWLWMLCRPSSNNPKSTFVSIWDLKNFPASHEPNIKSEEIYITAWHCRFLQGEHTEGFQQDSWRREILLRYTGRTKRPSWRLQALLHDSPGMLASGVAIHLNLQFWTCSKLAVQVMGIAIAWRGTCVVLKRSFSALSLQITDWSTGKVACMYIGLIRRSACQLFSRGILKSIEQSYQYTRTDSTCDIHEKNHIKIVHNVCPHSRSHAHAASWACISCNALK